MKLINKLTVFTTSFFQRRAYSEKTFNPLFMLLGTMLIMSSVTNAQRYPKAQVKATGHTSEEFKSITFNGGYNWTESAQSNAVSFKGKQDRTYVSWVDNYGDVHVGAYDNKSGEISSKQIFDNKENTAVTSTSLSVNAEGQVSVFVGFAQDELSFMAVASSDESIEEWDIKQFQSTGMYSIQPVKSTSEKGAIDLYWQNKEGDVFYAKAVNKDSALDNKQLLSKEVSNFKVITDKENGVHVVFTKNSKEANGESQLYYVKIKEGKVSQENGTAVQDLAKGTLSTDQLTSLSENTSGNAVWAWDIALTAENYPVIVYSTTTDTVKANYSRVVWNGKKWENKLLADANGQFAYTKETIAPYQVGGVTIDENSSDILYVSIKRGDFFEIEKWKTTNKGKSWKVEQLTSGSTMDNLLPMSVKGAVANQTPQVIWLQNTNKEFGVNRLENTNEWFLKRAITAVKLDVLSPIINQPLDTTQIKQIMHEVADWQLVSPRYNTGMLTATNWHYGAFYVGLRALYEMEEESRYKDELINIGQAYDWQLMDDIFHADRLAVVDNWAWLYTLENDPYMVDKSQWALDIHLAQNYKKLTDVRFKKSPYKHHWWTWCDALFMAPPSFVEMWKVTGEEKYLDYMSEQWWKTSDYLYSEQDSLFFRDDRFFEKRSENDKKIFWSRGNGWVVSALARILTYLPEDYPTRKKFEDQYKQIAAKLLELPLDSP